MKKFIVFAILLNLHTLTNAQILVSWTNVVQPCNADGSLSATATGGIPPYQIWWELYSGPYNDTGFTIYNLAPGYYTAHVYDAFGNTGSASYPLESSVQVTTVTTSNGTCPAGNGVVTATVTSGIPPLNFIWNNGQQFLNQPSNVSTINNLVTGYYFVSVIDSNGCTGKHLTYWDSAGYVTNAPLFYVSVSTTSSNCLDGTATANLSGSLSPPFSYYWNTIPVQSTQTATGLPGDITIEVVVTDANGCVNNQQASTIYGPGAIQSNATITNSVCGLNTGSINMNPFNGTAPYQYLWSSGDTTKIVSNLSPGNYTVTVTDFTGCANIFHKIIQSVSFLLVPAVIPANCGNTGGSATVSGWGAQPPYSYLWSNGNTSDTITNVSSGYYHVVVTDQNGCSSEDNVYVPFDTACMTFVSGIVYYDLNNDCISQNNERSGYGEVINLGNGSYISTGWEGYYSFNSSTLFNYSMTCNAGPLWIVNCPLGPINLSLSPGQFSTGNDFAIVPASTSNDVAINSQSTVVRPGFDHTRTVYIYNKGNTIVSGTVKVVHDSLESFVSSPNAVNYNAATRSITYNYILYPFFYGSFNAKMHIASTTAFGTNIFTHSTIFPVASDINPNDNTKLLKDIVVGSFDPNDIQVEPKGLGINGEVPPTDSNFNYTIRFQNTGTYLAQNITIIDTLDNDFDITSFQFLGATHYASWKIEGPGILKIYFQNIQLPDSNSNEPESHGAVKYQIKRKSNWYNGMQMTSTAYIYFDFNAPVVTNTTINTINILDVEEFSSDDLIIYPNPVNDYFVLSGSQLPNEDVMLSIINVSGQIIFVKNTSLKNLPRINVKELDNGVYFVQLRSDQFLKTGKIIVQH